MSRRIVITALAGVFALLLAGGCGGGREQKQRNDDSRRAWQESLRDSVSALTDSLQRAEAEVTRLKATADSLLPMFTRVDNPRYVEGFTIHQAYGGNYPLTATGITARMTESGALEIVACLKGGNFSRLRVTADGQEALTADVPNDQQLNYRQNGLNTVMFTGQEAMEFARFVHQHAASAETVAFLGSGVSGTLTLSAAQKRILGDTWLLVYSMRRSQALERQMPVMQAKIQAFERRLESAPAKD